MNIAYLWIEKYKNIENQGFHFSNKISIEIASYKERSPETDLNLEFILRRGENENKPWIYNEKISNITAIVGENGAGKTSLMEFLFNEVGQNTSDYFYLAIINVNDAYAFYTNIFSYKYENPDNIDLEVIDEYKYELLFDKVFYSNLFDYNISLHSNQKHDLTTTNMIEHANNQTTDLNRFNPIEFYRIEELNKQIEFIGSKYSKELPFDIPQQISLNIKDFRRLTEDEKFSLILQEKKLSPERLKIAEKFLLPNSDKPFKLNIANCLLHDLISKILWQSIHHIESFKEIELPKPDDNWSIDSVVNYFKSAQKVKNFDISNEYFKFKIDFILYLKDNEISDVYDISENSINDFKTFINRYKKSIRDTTGFLNFAWHQISSGERAMINLFSRFFSINNQIENKNVIIFLDEVETGFHPSWQKQLISIVNDFLPKMFSKNNLQIFISSHSPYILSDLPRDNVVFLKKENKKCHVDKGINHNKTFGANILDLFSDAFFLDSTIGSFALEKIKDAITIALADNKIETDINYAHYIADLIGDEIISYKLKKILKENVANNG